VIAAIRQNPLAYLRRIPRLTKFARWSALDIYGRSLGMVFFLLAVRGAIELIKKNQTMLLTIFLGWSSYFILYILLVFQDSHFLMPFLPMFSLASIGLTSVVAAFDRKGERAIWTVALLGVILNEIAGPQPPKLLFGALILLLGLWIVWIHRMNSLSREGSAAMSVILIFCVMLIINRGISLPRVRPSGISSEKSAVLFMRKHLKPNTAVGAYAPRDLWAAGMTWVSMIKSDTPEMISDENLREWLTKNKVEAIYLDSDFRRLGNPATWQLVERSIGEGVQVGFTSDDGNVRVLFVHERF
jgi:hypothetical protein